MTLGRSRGRRRIRRHRRDALELRKAGHEVLLRVRRRVQRRGVIIFSRLDRLLLANLLDDPLQSALRALPRGLCGFVPLL